jgi:hypothetical protein
MHFLYKNKFFVSLFLFTINFTTMKNLLLLPLAAMLCAACTQNEPEQTQDYTSFVITLNKGTEQSNVTLRNVVSGYFDKNGYCWKIAQHGTLSSKPSTERLSTDEYTFTIDVDSVYVFLENWIIANA